MSERALLGSCIHSREAYDRVVSYVESSDLTDQGAMIMAGIVDYYDRDVEATSVDVELLANAVGRSLTSDKHRETFTKLITDIAGAEVSPANVVADFLAVKREAVGHRLAVALSNGQDAMALVDEYIEWSNAETLGEKEEDEVLNDVELSDIVEQNYTADALIRLMPKSLNERIDGGCVRGHHVILFARPEMGKTLFLVNLMHGFLRQDLRVLYCGNEDPISDINVRVHTRLCGMTKFDVLADTRAATEQARQHGYSNLYMKHMSPGTPREIDRLCAEIKPDVLMVDQLRNLNVNEDQFTQQLERAARAVRAIGQKHNCLVVSVTQAGDSASGKAVLDMSDVDSSKTGIPAQADLLIGLGATAEDQSAGRRVLSLCKNKLSGRHEFFPVLVEPQISKMRSS